MLKPLETHELDALRRHRDTLSTFVTDRYFQLHPECRGDNEDRIRNMCREDLCHHFEFVLNALALGQQAIFADYAAWLRNVLESRQLAVEHAIDAFHLMQDYARENIDANPKESLLDVLAAGLDVLTGAATRPPVPLPVRDSLAPTAPYTQAIVLGDRHQATQIVNQSLDEGIAFVDLSVGVMQPAMYEVGRLWQSNRISIAHEHLATAMTQNLMAKAFTRAEFKDPVNRSAVFACIAGNHHSLGLRMVSDAFEINGWDVEFLGADNPTHALLSFLDGHAPDLLGISLSLPSQVITLKQVIDTLRSELGANMPALAVGGLAVNAMGGIPARLSVDAWFHDAKSAVEGAR